MDFKVIHLYAEKDKANFIETEGKDLGEFANKKAVDSFTGSILGNNPVSGENAVRVVVYYLRSIILFVCVKLFV